ncbi:MAG TPA: hypothetical protein DCM05_07385 [Elusimicrobia bacterium]|nr:hypothetical protein [Elusimicrobiota bacterium]
MDRLRAALSSKALRWLAAVAGVYACFFAGYVLTRRWASLTLDTGKSSYGRDEFVDIRLRTRDPQLRALWQRTPPRVRVARGGRPVPTIGGLLEPALEWDGNRGWVGRWPCPWKAEPGQYSLELASELPPRKAEALRAGSFILSSRRPRALPPRFAAVNWESSKPLASLKVLAPDGTVKDWRGLLDWVEYVGADAFWMLGGQTPGLVHGETWVTHNLPLIPEVARECRRRKLKFGVWAMCYLTMSAKDRVPGYEYALEIEEGRPKPTRALSLRDARRPHDVAVLLKRFAAIPEVDFIGLDYIRNPLGGYELVDDFMAEMPGVVKPPDWDRLTRAERMARFAQRKIARTDADFIDAWQWWRAHRAGRVIRQIREEVGGSKPLWAFVLTWEKGWQHGQDPVMFSDAGADALALMMYEADRVQFAQIMKDWRGYVRQGDAQLVAGNIVDWPLHQRSPKGPAEFGRRLDWAARAITPDGPAAGLFIHDLERALNGRLGPYTTRDWMDEARRVVRRFKALPS